jgi:arylsulfatase A-like enzyme
MIWSRRSFLAAAPAALLAQRKGAPAPARPNIALILAEDVPAWALSCYGNKEIRTPNLDLLARAGTRFTNN